jgi:Ca-activated chloride channel family protein
MRKRLWVAVTAVVVAALIACAKKAADKSSVQPSPPISAAAAPAESPVVPTPLAQLSFSASRVAKEVASFAGFNTEAYDHIEENRFHRVDADPLSTFSIDVDTASYANVRRFLADGELPPAGAVRTEELVNYFRFAYPQPSGTDPFSITTELAECPWNPKHRLALIGLQGRAATDRDPAPRNLVFLLDVSGSMMPADKLPLVRKAMRMLTDVLTERDRVAIVVYAGPSGLVLPSTAGDQKERIVGSDRASGGLAARPMVRKESSWRTRWRAATSFAAA